MKTITNAGELSGLADDLRRQGKRIGFVPTMGYLHEGHLSLVRLARKTADIVVMSIFVNPTQFGPTEDLSRYPRDLPRDSALAESCGTDILFVPSVEEMYPAPYRTYVEVEQLTEVLEGKSRPTHFRGVTTVVAKLLNIVKPHFAVFGQKDAQQAVVVKQMVRDLCPDVEIVIAPIVREPDGLAMSSRNVYLSPDERRQSTTLHKSLELAETMISRGERRCSSIIAEMNRLFSSCGSARVDYISIADTSSLGELSELHAGDTVLISLAVFIGKTRLIDNAVVRV